ncbi:glycosyltransferase family 2 protein [Polynucleobacter paneuropaeus]|jgi:glycosyltransferase involved in cell wall biosynthesis|nr:glycosyltransferase family 2 protein [Polynucleobacter paneuropaeus]
MKKKISILTPCYNEEGGIAECYLAIRTIFKDRLQQYDYEHIFIDNCSADRTVDILKEIAATDHKVKIIVNSRNFGLSRSPYHGKLQATGDAVIPVVADLQTPPEIIPKFIEKWEEGYKIVVGVRVGADEGWFIKRFRNLFYKLMTRISSIEQIEHFIGFGLFDKKIIQIMREMGDATPYFRGLVAEVGFDRAYVNYHQPPRLHGKSRHSFFDLIELAVLGIMTYSKFPIRLMTISGLILSALSLLGALIFVVYKLTHWGEVPMGVTPLVVIALVLGSFQIFCLGLLGEYIGIIFEKVRQRPLVIEKERINF